MKKLIKKLFFGRKAFQEFFYRMFQISIEGLNVGTGGRDMEATGEAWTLRYVLSQSPRVAVIFDVGAQGGEFIKKALKISEHSKIFAFEPNKRDFNSLIEEVPDRRVEFVNEALGANVSEGNLFYSKTVSGISSLYKTNSSLGKSQRVLINTVDAFCANKSIQQIDFLKIDVEGHELAVLEGSKGMLPDIKFIQFEFAKTSMESRTYFRDLAHYLSDYRIYRILRNGIEEIRNVDDKLNELLFTTNFLAIRK